MSGKPAGKVRQAKAQLEAKAAAAQARRRQKQADAAAKEVTTTAKRSSAAGCTRSSNAPIPHERWYCRRSRRRESILKRWVWGEAEPMAMPTWGLPSNDQGKPRPKAQRKFTDHDSHVMKCGNGYI